MRCQSIAFAALFSLASLPLVGCAASHPADVTWTVDGRPASEACATLGDTVRVNVTNRSTADAPGVAADPVTAPCTDGTAMVGLGTFATVFVELLRGDTVVGLGGPRELMTQGGVVGALNPLSGSIQVDTDIAIELGFLDVQFTAAQMSCADAGVGDVSVMLRRELTGLDFEDVWDAPVEYACEDGFTFDGAKVGSTYVIRATSTVDGREYGTAGSGQRISQNKAIVSTTVNLIDVELPTTN